MTTGSVVKPLADRHWCNTCVNRDFARLEAVESSAGARHMCALNWQLVKVCAFRLETGEVFSCNQFRQKRGGVS